MLLNRIGGLDRNLVIRRVAVFHRQVVIVEMDVEIGMDQLVADHVPDDPGHFVTIEFDDGICDLDLVHGKTFGITEGRGPYSTGG